MPRHTLYLSGDPDADALLSRDPLALVIGMLLDQQIPLEKAFRGPADLQARLGRPLDAGVIAAMDPEDLIEIFRLKPAIHRFPASMAGRVHELCRVVATDYAGKATRVWKEAADGPDVLARVGALPGFGDMKARIFVALLGKQLGLKARGWEAASAPFSEPGAHRSLADIVDAASLQQVRQFKQAMKAAQKAGGNAAPAASKAPAPKKALAKAGSRRQ
jgi:uncharacterized HhH-GPD family protein